MLVLSALRESAATRCWNTGALTGEAFHKDRLRRSPRAPSIDRIDSKKGYTPDNCQLITYIANCAKNQFTVDEFVRMCRAVVALHGKKARKQ
jgi:hypothetical protein